MSVKIENLTNRPVFLRLNSGRTLHLAPRATSSELRNVEVNKNDKVKKLRARHVIALHEMAKQERPTTGSKEEKAEPTEENVTA
jgi:hypothetical protein